MPLTGAFCDGDVIGLGVRFLTIFDLFSGGRVQKPIRSPVMSCKWWSPVIAVIFYFLAKTGTLAQSPVTGLER
jgi:hypothetical protein